MAHANRELKTRLPDVADPKVHKRKPNTNLKWELNLQMKNYLGQNPMDLKTRLEHRAKIPGQIGKMPGQSKQVRTEAQDYQTKSRGRTQLDLYTISRRQRDGHALEGGYLQSDDASDDVHAGHADRDYHFKTNLGTHGSTSQAQYTVFPDDITCPLPPSTRGGLKTSSVQIQAYLTRINNVIAEQINGKWRHRPQTKAKNYSIGEFSRHIANQTLEVRVRNAAKRPMLDWVHDMTSLRSMLPEVDPFDLRLRDAITIPVMNKIAELERQIGCFNEHITSLKQQREVARASGPMTQTQLQQSGSIRNKDRNAALQREMRTLQ